LNAPEFFRTKPKDEKKDGKEAEPVRADDFVIPEAFVSEWRYHIVPPPGFRVRQLPDQSDEKLGPASLAKRFQTEADGSVTGTVKFEIPKRRFSQKEALELRDALLAVEKKPMVFVNFDQIGETLLASGKVKEALVAFRELEKLHPNEGLHCHQVARALLAAGAGEAARAEARRGVELEPTSAKAYENLATVLKHDLVGRDLKKGYDRAGAVAAYRKALELDPDDTEARANLAILFEHDEFGRRYGAGAQMTEAIAEYRKIEGKLAIGDIVYPSDSPRAGEIIVECAQKITKNVAETICTSGLKQLEVMPDPKIPPPAAVSAWSANRRRLHRYTRSSKRSQTRHRPC